MLYNTKNSTCAVLLPPAALGAQSDPAGAGEVAVVKVVVRQSTAGVYRFDVTLRHADEGWGHYADGWEIRDGDGRCWQPAAWAVCACPTPWRPSPSPATTAYMVTAARR